MYSMYSLYMVVTELTTVVNVPRLTRVCWHMTREARSGVHDTGMNTSDCEFSPIGDTDIAPTGKIR